MVLALSCVDEGWPILAYYR